MTPEMNEQLTRVGPGTPCGELMRRYWQPAALAEELPPGGAPLPIRLLGEDLVLFRDDRGRPGLLGIHCSHRGADLSYGRLEDGGIRCIYHGWLYDINGRCLEQPGEPAGSKFHEKIRQCAYPCVEAGGMILTYMGPGEPPLVPAYPFLLAPDDRRFNSKIYHECNYLQGNEGNIDSVHTSFLHRYFELDRTMAYLAGDVAPILEAEETDFGVRLYSVRRVSAERNYVRITNVVLPDMSAFAARGSDGYTVNWHVPIDDVSHWKYVVLFSRDAPLDFDDVTSDRSEMAPGYRLARNKANRYLQDREQMKTQTFTGMGRGFQGHDLFATQGMGPIQDRTQEHLGSTDKAIVLTRRVMLDAIRAVQEGRDPPHVLRTSAEVPTLVARADAIPASVDWHNYWERPAAELASATGLK